jgi:hypothetical protein
MDTQSRRLRFDWRFWIALAVLIGLAFVGLYGALKASGELVSEGYYAVERWFSLLLTILFVTVCCLSLRPFGLWFQRFSRTKDADRPSWRTQVKRGALVAWMFNACALGSLGANLVLRSMSHDAHHSCIHRGAPFWSWSTLLAPPLVLLATGVWAGRKVLSPKSAAVLASVWALATAVPTMLAIADAAALTAAATIGGRYDLYHATPAACSLVWGSVLLVLVLVTARVAIGRTRAVRG